LFGSDVDQPRKIDAARPLDLAVETGFYGVACLLLEEGAEVREDLSYVMLYDGSNSSGGSESRDSSKGSFIGS
jgi:hypothetical protein